MRLIRKSAHALVVSAWLAPAALTAQDAATYYSVRHPEQFAIDWAGFYRKAEQQTALTRSAFPHQLDIPYGPDPKQRLDLYLPAGAAPSGAPVLVFLHGGGFREGDRAQYGFVARPFLERGIVTAVASYRLAGQGARYPDPPQDAQRIVQWLHRNVQRHGGNPDDLYLGGHSAGAILAGDLGADRSWMDELGIPRQALRGIVAISGRYDLSVGGRPGERDLYAPTPEAKRLASPLNRIKDPVPCALVALGAGEPERLDDSRKFAARLGAAGATAKLLVIKGADHSQAVERLADPASELFRESLATLDCAGARR
jgi:acetyl esterase/lipase